MVINRRGARCRGNCECAKMVEDQSTNKRQEQTKGPRRVGKSGPGDYNMDRKITACATGGRSGAMDNTVHIASWGQLSLVPQGTAPSTLSSRPLQLEHIVGGASPRQRGGQRLQLPVEAAVGAAQRCMWHSAVRAPARHHSGGNQLDCPGGQQQQQDMAACMSRAQFSAALAHRVLCLTGTQAPPAAAAPPSRHPRRKRGPAARRGLRRLQAREGSSIGSGSTGQPARQPLV